jgi:AAA15 family ATPase/GTPase
MLDSLYIKNYRKFKELKINSLKRINLLSGKNNTGKSSILEAIQLYVSGGELKIIYEILNDRGEFFYNTKKIDAFENYTEANKKMLSAMFNKRIVGFDKANAIVIQCEEKSKVKTLDFSFKNENQKLLFLIGAFGLNGNFPLDQQAPIPFGYKMIDTAKIQFVKTRNLGNDFNSKLFDTITLTDKEKEVVKGLNIIDEDVLGLNFIDEGNNSRIPFVKIRNEDSPMPLQSMGDGINKILSIILALVNCEDGYLLIDEFENGLHYSVQEKIWEVIFSLSERLNIQVFVTTHSNDSIVSFEKILNKQQDKNVGQLIRLDNKNGDIVAVDFDAEELETVVENDIEIR